MTMATRQLQTQWRMFSTVSRQQSCLSSLAHRPTSTASPVVSVAGGMPVADVNREHSSDKSLFHRTLVAELRQEGKRGVKRVRKRGWLPSILRGRGKIPDALLQVDPVPVAQDLQNEMYCFQKRAVYLATGPLYELRILPTGLDEYNEPITTDHLPFERIRVAVHNLHVHPVSLVPLGLQLTYVPENERVRMRIPIVFINEEKAPGINDGGWLNRLLWNIEISVDAFVPPPRFALMDVAGLRLKQKLYVKDLQFAGKEEGCATTLPGDTPAVIVSKL